MIFLNKILGLYFNIVNIFCSKYIYEIIKHNIITLNFATKFNGKHDENGDNFESGKLLHVHPIAKRNRMPY